MEAIAITSKEELLTLLESLSDEIKAKIMHILHKPGDHRGLVRMKKFVDNFDDESPVDGITASVCAQLINNIDMAIKSYMHIHEDYNGRIGGIEVSKELVKLSQTILKAAMSNDDHDDKPVVN